MSESYQQWAKLEKWLEDKHPGYQSNLSLRDVPGLERGLVAHASQYEDTLLHMPASSMLNPLTLIQDTPIPLHLFPQSSSRPRRTTTGPSLSSASMNKGDEEESAKRRKPNSQRLKLDTTQLLSLHLALTKDPKGRYPSPWAAYIDTLPAEFRPWHPLTWLIPPSTTGPMSTSATPTSSDDHPAKRTKHVNPATGTENGGTGTDSSTPEAEWSWWNNLAEVGISPSTKRKVEDVKKRFEEDYAVLKEVLKDEEPFKSHQLAEVLDQEAFLWAWLNVNTRSISIPLGLGEPSERMNHTLVPVMDFINHSSDPNIITPRVKQLPTASKARRISQPNPNSSMNGAPSASGNSTNPISPITLTSATIQVSTSTNANTNAHALRKADKHLIPGKIDLRLLCPERGLEEDEEVFFEYGGHPSSTLFAEYGFCEVPKSQTHNQSSQSDEDGNLLKANDSSKALSANSSSPTQTENGKTTDKTNTESESESRVASGWLDMRYGEVDVSWLVNELWESMGEDEAAEKKEVLEAIGCWGGNTLHAQSSPAHPSHSLLMTLRVLHTPTSSPKLPSIARGLISYVSPQVEDRTIESLEGICKRISKEAKKRAGRIDKLFKSLVKVAAKGPVAQEDGAENGEDGDVNTKRGVLDMLRAMCEEEIVLATRVAERIQKGEEL
ncbi:hypothetical protein IAT40_006638 [Kwoniella sp. CBS 6097]